METTYKGCTYKYKKHIRFDGKPDRDNSIVIEKIKPIDSSSRTICYPAFLDGRKVSDVEYGALPDKGEYEIIVDEGVEFFSLCRLNCKLTGLVLPKTLTAFDPFVFKESRLYLKKIVVAKDNPIFNDGNNANCLIETKTNKLILIGINSEIPETINEIGDRVFLGRKDLEHLVIPSSVTVIGQNCFQFCALPPDFALPPSIKLIKSSAFSGVSGINELNLPNVEAIQFGAFAISPISKITFGDKLKSIGQDAFRLCEVKELTLPDSLTSLSPSAFASSNIKTIYCSEKVANFIAKTKASKKIKLVIGNQKTTIGNLLNKPDNVFDLDACIKTRKNLFARNINIDMVVDYGSSYDGDMGQNDGYNYYDYKDTVVGTLQGMPSINASSFNKDILTKDDGSETVLHNLTETFEYDGVYAGFLTMVTTDIFKYLKYKYDSATKIYHITGIKGIHSIGYLALGFGKEKIIIDSKAFDKRKIVNLYIGPNVIAIMEDAFPSLTNTIVSIAEGVDYIAPHAFTMTSHGYFRCAHDKIPPTWSNKWNQHNRTFYTVIRGYKPLKLSSKDIEDKANNYNKYHKVTWDNEYSKNDYDTMFNQSLNDVDKLIKLIELDDGYLQKLPEKHKNNPQIFLRAVCKNPSNFLYVGNELKKNKSFILETIKRAFGFGDSIIPYIDKDLLNDFDFMKQVIEIKESAVSFLGDKLKDNAELWLISLKKGRTGINLEDYKGPLLSDIDFAKKAIEINGHLIACFDQKIKSNRDLAIAAIKSNGAALGFVDKSLGFDKDKEIVKMAISSNYYSYHYACKELRLNEEIALFAVQKSPYMLEEIEESLLTSKNFILKALNVMDEQSRIEAAGNFLSEMNDDMRMDKKFVTELRRMAKEIK